MSQVLNLKIKYKSPNLLQFYITKRKEGIESVFILVMIMLHYLPRFQQEPAISQNVRNIIFKVPNTFRQIAENNRTVLLG